MLPERIRFLQRGWFNSNATLILGDEGPMIIDTGHEQDAADTLQLLRTAGVDPASLSLIANTHCHWDHHGGNAALKAASGALVAHSRRTAELFQRQDRWAMWMDYFGQEATLVMPDVIWEIGQDVRLNGLTFQVLEAAGHAMDAIALYQPDHRVLICGDALLDGDFGILNVAVHGWEALDAAEATLRRFQALDVAVALPGHGPAFTHVDASADLMLKRLEKFRRHPAWLARHLIRRVLLVYLMGMAPIGREAFIAYVLPWPWVQDYTPWLGSQDAAGLFHKLIDEYVLAGMVTQENGLLMTHIVR